MLHPRHHLLSDVAALVEIDAVQAVHVGFVRKRVAIHEIEAAARNAGRDAMGVIGCAIEQIRANQIGDFLREFRWHKNPPAERGIARIGERQIGRHRGPAIPRREHTEAVGEIFDRDLGAQFVETKLVGEALRERARAVDQETAAVARRRFGDQEIHRYFALRGQQGPEPAEARAKQRHVGGDKAVEKVAGVGAADLDHAPVGKKRCFHKEFSGKVVFEVLGERQAPDITWQRKTLRYCGQGPRDIRFRKAGAEDR